MKIYIIFVTGSKSVIDTINNRKSALIPADMRSNGFSALSGREVLLLTFDTNRGASLEGLIGHLARLDLASASGVILLTDETIPDLKTKLGDSLNVNIFNPPNYGCNFSNFLSATINKCLKSFRYFSRHFEDAKYQHIFRLPLRNFAAPEINKMREACHDMINNINYSRDIEASLQGLRRRQHPKRASDFPDIYYVDDEGKHFRLGHEMHARADTAIPPHNQICDLTNRFRFGHVFDGRTHYNVSRDGNARMTGSYLDCHGILRRAENETHLNMFSNDFF